jgi:hypothetical protein
MTSSEQEANPMHFLHPANAEELANVAKETGAEVLRGPLRYPSETGSWQLGDVDLGKYLWQYRDHEVTLILAVTGKVEEQIVCGICGFVMDKVGDCPRCKLLNQAIAGAIKAWQEGKEEMLREVAEILRGEDE